MNAIEIVALFVFLRVIVPVAMLLWLGEWVRRRSIRHYGHM